MQQIIVENACWLFVYGDDIQVLADDQEVDGIKDFFMKEALQTYVFFKKYC
jgi:hypothetical protein